MSTAATIVGTSSLQLWGVDSRTRLERQLAGLGPALVPVSAPPTDPGAPVLLLNADFVFELRTIKAMLRRSASALYHDEDPRVAAAMVSAADAAAISACMTDPASPLPAGVEALAVADLESFDGELRRVDPPLLEPLNASKLARLESELYGNAYKGITDLVTKWWWPRPARVIVGWCARAGISPNQVTVLGVLLVLLSTYCFAAGFFAVGLASAWLMTLLDTVDGKLARVTVQSSRIGHVLDHGTDIIHPPFWYVFWLQGLGAGVMPGGFTQSELAWAVAGGYVIGRLIEGAFELFARCSMFAWRPLDAWFRLITARRNPCLIILTVLLAAGRPDWAILGVVGWTVISTALLALRLLYAALQRLRGDALESWLADPAYAARHYPAAYRTFAATRGAYR